MKEESNTKIYIFDIDGTICETKNGDYKNARPYKDRIEKINKLYDEGNIIIYETARGDMTGTNYIDFTRKQLKEWGCKYKSVGSKHYADIYIDDHAINSNDFFK